MSLFVKILICLLFSACVSFTMYKMAPVAEVVIENKDSNNICLWIIGVYINSLFYKRNILGKLMGLIQLIISIPTIVICNLCQLVYWMITFLEFIFSYTGKKEKEDKLEEDNE